MATLPGIKEKVHLPLYDSFVVPGPAQTFGQVIGPENRLRFFVDIQQKTRLETNLQAAGVLPHHHTFEARGMRVIISPPGVTTMLQDRSITLLDVAAKATRFHKREAWDVAAFTARLEAELLSLQATALAELIFSSVTSLIVGEKVMIEMPTFWFPAGAGVSSGDSLAVSHGLPDPQATFRFAEPVFIEARQNFRVELTFPQGVPSRVAATPGPLRLWIILDGYLTRDVQ
jgi:hypothetical protein